MGGALIWRAKDGKGWRVPKSHWELEILGPYDPRDGDDVGSHGRSS